MSYKSIFQDVRNAVDFIHLKGDLKRRTVAECDKYVQQDPDLLVLLKRLRSAGKKIFLLTNSEWWYTNEVRLDVSPHENSSERSLAPSFRHS